MQMLQNLLANGVRKTCWNGSGKKGCNRKHHIRTVSEMKKMERKSPKGRPMLRWSEETRKPERSGRNGLLTRRDGNVSARPVSPHRATVAKVEKI